MTFDDQIWLALTPLLALISIALISLGWRKRGHLLGKFAAARLLDSLTEKASVKRKLLKSGFIVAAVCTVGIALARPQYGVEWSERKARGLDIVFVLDSSKSMLATDLRPTRLERAKLAILDLIDRLESDRIGLVAFAGQAFLQTPPTLDYNAFRESLNATAPSILSRGGSDLGRAIEEAAKAFPSENNVKVVVLLTDGEDLGGRAVASARAMAKEGIRIFAIGIGTPEGEYLRIQNAQGIEEFVRDNNGQPVRSQLDESTLQEIAQITGGSYSGLGGGSLNTLYDSVLATLPREERASEVQEVRIERFQWFLAAALAFLVLEILIRSRRPKAAEASALLLALLFALPNSTEASPYNEAHAALSAGDFAKANELYTEAMQLTDDRSLQRDALYNMGHATYQIGRSAYDGGDAQTALEEIRSAEQLFEAAMEIDPTDEGIAQDLERTRKVREAIEKLLEQQENQEQEKQENQEQNQDESSDSQEQENQEQSGEEQNTKNQSGGEESGEQSDQQPSQESGESNEEGEGQEPVPEVGEPGDETNDETNGSGQPTGAVQVEGMTLEEAQDLLDSLRGKEEILPFAKPVPGQGRPLKDW